MVLSDFPLFDDSKRGRVIDEERLIFCVLVFCIIFVLDIF